VLATAQAMANAGQYDLSRRGGGAKQAVPLGNDRQFLKHQNTLIVGGGIWNTRN
jgi:hypothetical protein